MGKKQAQMRDKIIVLHYQPWQEVQDNWWYNLHWRLYPCLVGMFSHLPQQQTWVHQLKGQILLLSWHRPAKTMKISSKHVILKRGYLN